MDWGSGWGSPFIRINIIRQRQLLLVLFFNAEPQLLNILSQVQAIQNAAVADVYGMQAGLEVKLPAGFTFLSDLNYQVGEEELDDGKISPSRHAAPLFGLSRLRFRKEGLTLEFNAVYQGERRFDDLAVSERSKDEIYAKDADGNNYSNSQFNTNLPQNGGG